MIKTAPSTRAQTMTAGITGSDRFDLVSSPLSGCVKSDYTRVAGTAGPLARSSSRRQGPPTRDCETARCAAPLWNLQNLARPDLVRVGQLVLVRLEDLHVGVRVAKVLLRDLAQCIAGLDRVRSPGGSCRGARRRRRGSRCGSARSPGTACDADVGDDVLLPVGDGLDGIPDLVLVIVGRHRSGEMQLSVTLLGVALKTALGCLNSMRVLVSQTHQ